MPLDIWNDLRDKLPSIKAEYERLGQLIAMIEGGVSLPETDDGETQTTRPMPPANHSGNSANAGRGAAVAIGRDDFVGMSTSEAIRAFLTKMGRGNPQGPRAMARALVQGGRGDADEDVAYANVSSSLKRLKKNGDVKQVRRGEWGLSSWYLNKPKDGAE
jgi:hypothetical protein